MTDQPKFTLREASRELAKRECAARGHDFDVVVTLGGAPRRVICSRCGDSWRVDKFDLRRT